MPLSRTERALLTATSVVVVAGTATWLALGGWRAFTSEPSPPPARPPAVGRSPDAPDPVAPPPVPPEEDDGTEPTPRGAPGALGGAVPSGLRVPSGEDLSDPARVKELLRQHLAEEDVRWDVVAQLLGVLHEPLEADLKRSLQSALVEGNAAGAIQAYERLNDGSVVPDLVRLLDDSSLDAHDRANVLVALARIPGGDPGEVVRGIEARLTGDPVHDLPYWRAISQKGGAEAARALVEAIGRSANPGVFTWEMWRDFDVSKDAGASSFLAYALKDKTLSPAALRAVVELAGRPGAEDLVASLLALDAEDQPDLVRRQVFTSLARTGDEKAIARLLEGAKQANYGSIAARALGQVHVAGPAARARILEAAKASDDPFFRRFAVQALGNLREDQAVPMLADLAVGSADVPLRNEAVLALGRIGPKAVPAIPALSQAFSAGDDATKTNVAVALAEMGAPEAEALLKQLRIADSSPLVRRAISAALNRYQKDS